MTPAPPSSPAAACTPGTALPGPAPTIPHCSHPPILHHPFLCPPHPRAAASGSWVTFISRLLEALPAPFLHALSWKEASFVTVCFKRPTLPVGSPGCSASSSSCWHSSAAATTAVSLGHLVPVLSVLPWSTSPRGTGALGAGPKGAPRCRSHHARQPMVGAWGTPSPPLSMGRGCGSQPRAATGDVGLLLCRPPGDAPEAAHGDVPGLPHGADVAAEAAAGVVPCHRTLSALHHPECSSMQN